MSLAKNLGGRVEIKENFYRGGEKFFENFLSDL
jgi:hypothetical protein